MEIRFRSEWEFSARYPTIRCSPSSIRRWAMARRGPTRRGAAGVAFDRVRGAATAGKGRHVSAAVGPGSDRENIWFREVSRRDHDSRRSGGQEHARLRVAGPSAFSVAADVHLGIDPEFFMHNNREGRVPGSKIGSMDAKDVDLAIDYLAQLVTKYKFPPKVLVIHRFTTNMLSHANRIELDPRVQVVINMDGWGQPWHKFDTYKTCEVKEPVQFTGSSCSSTTTRRRATPCCRRARCSRSGLDPCTSSISSGWDCPIVGPLETKKEQLAPSELRDRGMRGRIAGMTTHYREMFSAALVIGGLRGRPAHGQQGGPPKAPTSVSTREECRAGTRIEPAALISRSVRALGLDAAGDRVLHFKSRESPSAREQSDRWYPPYLNAMVARDVWVDPVAGAERHTFDTVWPGSGGSAGTLALVAERDVRRARFELTTPALISHNATRGVRFLYRWVVVRDWSKDSTVRFAGECMYRDYWRVVLARDVPEEKRSSYVDPKSAYPVKLQYDEPHYLWGQFRVENVYTTWITPRGGGSFPGSVTDSRTERSP